MHSLENENTIDPNVQVTKHSKTNNVKFEDCSSEIQSQKVKFK